MVSVSGTAETGLYSLLIFSANSQADDSLGPGRDYGCILQIFETPTVGICKIIHVCPSGRPMWFSVIGTTETGLYSLLSFLQNPGLMMVLVRDKAGAVFSNLKSPRQWARLKLWGPSHLHQGRGRT